MQAPLLKGLIVKHPFFAEANALTKVYYLGMKGLLSCWFHLQI